MIDDRVGGGRHGLGIFFVVPMNTLFLRPPSSPNAASFAFLVFRSASVAGSLFVCLSTRPVVRSRVLALARDTRQPMRLTPRVTVC